MFSDTNSLSKRVGIIKALQIQATHSYAKRLCKLGARPNFRPISASVDGLAHPVLLRPATSDYLVFCQVLIRREYAPITEFKSPKLIVDCGANVGYTSAYFLSCFPDATLIALEPDPDNFQICSKNLMPYGGRAKVLQNALWSHRARLTLLHFGALGDEGEMGVQVFEKIGDDFPEHVHRGINPPVPVGEVDALDINSILEMGSPIDILKLDVEKAEMVIFNDPNLTWIKHVRNIVIELHNEKATQIFRRAMEPYAYDFLTSGELSMCRNIRSK